MNFKNSFKMIRISTLTILYFGLCLRPDICHQELQAQTKKALLIGVGNYPKEGGWASLHSENDIKLVKNTLMERGFVAENIMELADDKATKSGILNTLHSIFLNTIKPGDVIYLQFSGHGQQKKDFDGDETDGYDECIVPYDSPKKYQKGVYEGQNLITDDELETELVQIREKLGTNGHLIVVLDACHSGTGTRGISFARGTTEIMADSEYIHRNSQESGPKENNELQRSKKRHGPLCPMVAFFGSAQNQLNYEMTTETGEHFGSLSYALCKWLSKAKPEDSYRGLFDNIRMEMSTIAPLQTPQSEGELDLEIANGRLLKTPNYYKIAKIISDTVFSIKAGELHGILKGSEVEIYPAETRDLENKIALAKGRVVQSFPVESLISLDAPMSKEAMKSAWVFVTQKSFGSLTIGIRIQMVDKILEKRISQEIYSKSYIKNEQETPKLLIKQAYGPKTLSLESIDGYTLDSFNNVSPENIDRICTKLHQSIRKYLQGEYIRKMELEGSDIKVSFKIVPVDSLTDDTDVDNIKFLKVDETGKKQMALKSKFQFLIVNEGIKPAYFSIIDLQPDNIYSIIVPKAPITPEEMRILPDQKILLPIKFDILLPTGTEVFKLISSEKPVDLNSSLGTRGGIKRSPFEKLFQELRSDEEIHTRGIPSSTIPLSDINIFSDTFIITNKIK